ncbi:MAG: hypothetical protein ACXABV_07960 [Candidatus Thorarchaeota archaeon]|jgi:hypothetical protein
MFTCRKCREPYFVQAAQVRGRNLRVFLQCINGHKDKRDLSQFQADNAAFELFQGLFTCVQCGSIMDIASTDAHRDKVEYIFLCPIHGPQRRVAPTLYHPTVNQLRTEVNAAKSVLDSMSCPRCGQVFVIHEIGEKGEFLELKSKCPNGHKEMRFVTRDADESIMKTVLKRLVHCDTCGLPCTIQNKDAKRDKMRVELLCPVHGSSKKEFPIAYAPLLNDVSQAVTEGSRLRSTLKCADCGMALAVRSIEDSKGDYKIKTTCANGHSFEMVQKIDWSDESAEEISRAILKCNECDLLTEIASRKVDGTKAEIEVSCPLHGSTRKGLTVDVYKNLERMEESIDRQPSIDESLKCVRCGTPVVIKEVKTGKETVEAKVECQRGHGDSRHYLHSMTPAALVTIYDKAYECHKCHQPLNLMEIEQDNSKSIVKMVCEKHGERKHELPFEHSIPMRDAFTAKADMQYLESVMEKLPHEEVCDFQFDPGSDIEELLQIVRSVIEQHDLHFVSETKSDSMVSAWYYGKALQGDQFVVVGAVSEDNRDIKIRVFSDNEKSLSTLLAHMRENLREVLLRIRADADDIQPLVIHCEKCGAGLSKRGLPGETTLCEHCGVPLHW